MKREGRFKLSYTQFKKEIRERIKGYLPLEYGEAGIIIEKASQNNNQDSDILIICRENGEPYPSFNLKLLHENYISGISIGEILKEAAGYLCKIANNEFIKSKENIILTIINKEWNEKLLKGIPYKDFYGLAIVYRYAYQMDNMLSSVQMDKEIFKKLEISEDDLFEMALNNTQRLFPVKIQSIEEACLEVSEEVPKNKVQELSNVTGLFILTNVYKIYGAATILYPGILHEIGKQLNSDFSIMPLSVDQMIVMADQGHRNALMQREKMRSMKAIDIPKEDQLSENIFRYLRTSKKLTLIKERTDAASTD